MSRGPTERRAMVGKQRHFREDDDEVWNAAQEKARREGSTLSAKIRLWLRAYLALPDDDNRLP